MLLLMLLMLLMLLFLLLLLLLLLLFQVREWKILVVKGINKARTSDNSCTSHSLTSGTYCCLASTNSSSNEVVSQISSKVSLGGTLDLPHILVFFLEDLLSPDFFKTLSECFSLLLLKHWGFPEP